MQPKAVEGLPTGMIFAKAGTVVKPMAAIGARKLADRDRHTIHDRHRRIIEQEAVTDKAPQLLFHGPQVGRLAHKGRTIDLRHRWEKVCVVAAEVVKHFLILAQTQVGSGHFDRHDFAIGQFGQGTSFAQALSFRHGWQHLVNQTETCDNKVVQVHGFPPQKLTILLRRVDSMNLSFGKNTCTSG